MCRWGITGNVAMPKNNTCSEIVFLNASLYDVSMCDCPDPGTGADDCDCEDQ